MDASPKIIIPYQLVDIEGCVYKLWCEDYYIVIKAKRLVGSISVINQDFDIFLKKDHKDYSGRNSFYFKFFTHRRDNDKIPIQIEILLETNNAYQLLKAEQIELNKSIYDPKCLNNNVQSYIPKFRNDMYGWIKPTWVLNYKKFLKKV